MQLAPPVVATNITLQLTAVLLTPVVNVISAPDPNAEFAVPVAVGAEPNEQFLPVDLYIALFPKYKLL
jgi:hypothetical protein